MVSIFDKVLYDNIFIFKSFLQVRTCHGDVISQPIAKKYVHQVDESCA